MGIAGSNQGLDHNLNILQCAGAGSGLHCGLYNAELIEGPAVLTGPTADSKVLLETM